MTGIAEYSAAKGRPALYTLCPTLLFTNAYNSRWCFLHASFQAYHSSTWRNRY
jgi:hypothetical protein